MARNLAQLVDVIEQALNGVSDPRTAAKDTINEAGRYLCACHAWKFLERPTATGAFVADQEYVALPTDFEQLLGVETYYSTSTTVRAVSRTELDYLRSGPMINSLDSYVAVEYPPQPSATTAQGKPRLAIWPTPNANLAQALRITYRAGWVELADNASIPNIPADMEFLLIEVARALAQGRRPGGDTSIVKLDALENSTSMNRLKAKYGQVQGNLGQLQGGVVCGQGRGDYRPYTSLPSAG